MRVAVEKLEGVEGAEVSLNEGHVTVDFAPQHAVTVAELRRTIRAQGFSPREARVRVSGRLEERNGSLVLVFPGGSFRLEAAPPRRTELRRRLGEEVILAGGIAPDEDGGTPATLVLG